MVRMMVRQKDIANLRQFDAGLGQLQRDTVAAIDHIGLAVDHQDIGGRRAHRGRRRAAFGAEQDPLRTRRACAGLYLGLRAAGRCLGLCFLHPGQGGRGARRNGDAHKVAAGTSEKFVTHGVFSHLRCVAHDSFIAVCPEVCDVAYKFAAVSDHTGIMRNSRIPGIVVYHLIHQREPLRQSSFNRLRAGRLDPEFQQAGRAQR